MKKIMIVVGTRPNFIKITRFRSLAEQRGLDVKIVHTGQHFDANMAEVFFKQFNLQPDHFLNISSGSPSRQLAEIVLGLEDLVAKSGKPDLLLVPGDVNSTLAAALFAHKSHIRLGHIEAGLRSFDRTMPEELNRVLTDELSDLYFVTEPSGLEHLRKENKKENKIHFVGNTMIDTMVAFDAQIKSSAIMAELSLQKEKFVLMTMHRPATVDHATELKKLLDLIDDLSATYKIVFPIHPRTVKNAKEFGLYERISGNTRLVCTPPLDYFAFQNLIMNCAFIVTDSGGIQEESTFRRKPCLTLRPNTERPVTITTGTNTLLPFEPVQIRKVITSIGDGTYKKGNIPEHWDGHATERILDVISSKG